MKNRNNYSGNATVGLAASVLAGTLCAGLAPAQAQETKGWESVAGAGVTLTRGNSKSFLATANLDTKRKWAKDEALLGGAAGYGKTTVVTRGADPTPDEETKTAAFAKGYGQYNHLFSERLYGAFRADVLHDDISDVHYRVTLAPLVGYYFIKSESTTLSADIGPSWVIEKVGEAGARGYLGLRLGERFEHKFKNGARIWQMADLTPEVENWENYVVNFELGAAAPITKSLSTRIVLQDTYDNQPTPGRLKNDLKLLAGLEYKF
jgi:hypothetical protein